MRGLEPPASKLSVSRSYQLSYIPKFGRSEWDSNPRASFEGSFNKRIISASHDITPYLPQFQRTTYYYTLCVKYTCFVFSAIALASTNLNSVNPA